MYQAGLLEKAGNAKDKWPSSENLGQRLVNAQCFSTVSQEMNRTISDTSHCLKVCPYHDHDQEPITVTISHHISVIDVQPVSPFP
jgi:hypothetical protein